MVFGYYLSLQSGLYRRVNCAMRHFDIFNGDADGLCGITQLRLARSGDGIPITGVKRDINLLKRVEAKTGDSMTVVDISLEQNHSALETLLAKGCSISWFDHHHSPDIPTHPLLSTHIDTHRSTCSSLIVNEFLGNKFHEWAVVAAFGDNLATSARRLAHANNINDKHLELFNQLGRCINYNSYGDTIGDLIIKPIDLYHKMVNLEHPLELINGSNIVETLQKNMDDDSKFAQQIPLAEINSRVAVVVLPNEKWARRVSGFYANQLANSFPDRSHAVLIEKDNNFLVSLRAPKNEPFNAHKVAKIFPTGGGREAAAGIQHLSKQDQQKLINEMTLCWG